MEKERIEISKQDKIWSYLAQFLTMGIGVITLPFLLNKLTPDEIGVNYILITISSVVALVDLGFAPQFSRNFSYVFSGIQDLKKQGLGESGESVNFELLQTLLKAAKHIYSRLSLLALGMLLIVGTPYLYITTDKFTLVNNIEIVWLIYSIGIVFQVYYTYYSSLLIGRGLIMEQKIATISTKVLYLIILVGCLYAGLGLMSVALAQVISPFLGRYISHKKFYTSDLKNSLAPYRSVPKTEIWRIVKILWYNAKRTAVMSIGAYAVVRMGMFIAGLFFTLEEFASYGLMVQLVVLLASLSTTVVTISHTKYASLRANGENIVLIRQFAGSMFLFYCLFAFGATGLVLFGNMILELIHSNASLPAMPIVAAYCIIELLEYNHSCFAGLISTENTVPFAPASVITGIFICIGSYIVCRYTSWGIMGLILVQGICQLAYQNWKWPWMALKSFDISFMQFLSTGFKQFFK